MAALNRSVNRLKELGDQQFRRGNFAEARDRYTDALLRARGNPGVSSEMIRTILANRAQTYWNCDNIHNVLTDLNDALSAQYTTSESPKILTVKYLFRRARALHFMAKYDEANADYGELLRLLREMGLEPSEEQMELKAKIDKGTQAGVRSRRRRKDELMRAIDARGFILPLSERDNFPLPSPEGVRLLGLDPSVTPHTLQFDTHDRRPNPRLTDPNTTPILIPVMISAPYFNPNPNSPGYRTFREPLISENETVDECIGNIFISVCAFSSLPSAQACMPSAIRHQEQSSVLAMTAKGRIFLIPRNTKIKDIIAGARWPRPQNSSNVPTFTDLSAAPRLREHEIDGMELNFAWQIMLCVIPHENKKTFLEDSEYCKRSWLR